jgi:hypothetical protein
LFLGECGLVDGCGFSSWIHLFVAVSTFAYAWHTSLCIFCN